MTDAEEREKLEERWRLCAEMERTRDEMFLRFLAAQRDFPELNHVGQMPYEVACRIGDYRFEELKREFERR